MTVVRTLTVTGPTMVNDHQALVRVDHTYVGLLDLATARLEQESTGLHGAGDLTLRLSEGRWRIVGPDPAGLIGVPAAIRYLTALREKTTDASGRKNADRALAALRQVRNATGRRSGGSGLQGSS